MFSITTKYLGATNTKGSRIRAQVRGRSIKRFFDMPYDHMLDASQNHAQAAAGLLARIDALRIRLGD